MKKIILTFSSMFLLFACFSANPGGKVIVQKYTGSDAQGAGITVSWYLQNNALKLKMDYADANIQTATFFIPDQASMKLLTYTEDHKNQAAQKLYYSIPVEKISSTTGNSLFNVKHTGEKKMINGFNCEKLLVKGSNSTTEIWLTTDFTPEYYVYYPFFRSSIEIAVLNQEQLKGFPLVSTTRDLSGKIIAGYELVNVSNADMGPNDFNIPADYQLATDHSKDKH